MCSLRRMMTCQRLVNKIFRSLIGRTMEVYVDDMITKSKSPSQTPRGDIWAFEEV